MDPNSQASAVNTPAIKKRPIRATARYRSFDRYLRIIQKQIHPACKISASSLTALNSMVGSLFKRIATEAQTLAQKQKRPTLLARDIEFACRLVLPTELHENALDAGDTAVKKYQDTLNRDRRPRE